ncbi:hypothetical protein [Brenneria uluponensis]|uniref:hypothetical protein n=1 Tax=Brenneria uluponensis TaxID=3057057 RepID=UPI0028E73D70|nr:hypothetical protein [Brenneria ulupoensis]
MGKKSNASAPILARIEAYKDVLAASLLSPHYRGYLHFAIKRMFFILHTLHADSQVIAA